LGALWQEMTGLPFVFAVFAVRKEWAQSNSEAVKAVLEALKSSVEFGLGHQEEIDKEARAILGQVPPDFDGYFKGLGYQWSEDMKKGLLLFYKYAKEWKYAPGCEGL